MIIYNNIFNDIVSLDNLFLSWEEFKKGKTNKRDVLEFELNLEQNIFKLHKNLKNHSYKHGKYTSFSISDPKPRKINKATIIDRILHHAACRVIIPIFEPTFIAYSFSCQKNKGTHKGVKTLGRMTRKASKNNLNSCFVLKCDVKKFFENIDHNILLQIIFKKIKDKEAQDLITEIVESFNPGIPLGNVTSQWFANIYLNALDQYLKKVFKVKNYIRYTDDFLIIHSNSQYLNNLISVIEIFLRNNLNLKLHPRKTEIKKYIQGVDFLGYITLPHYRLIRTKTKKRIIKRINKNNLPSYLGVLSHANSYKFKKSLDIKFFP